MKSFFRAMLDCKEEIYEKRDRAAADVYSMVEEFLIEGNYSSYRQANSLAELKLKGYSNSVIAGQLGISEATVRTHVRNVSGELYQLFGVSFLSYLSNYSEYSKSVNSVMYRVKYLNRMASSYIMPDVVSRVRSSTFGSSSYALEDCSREIDFLKRYSFSFLDGALKNVDDEKVKFLLDILDGKVGTPEDWSTVVSSIVREGNKND